MVGQLPNPPRLFVVGSYVEAHCWTVSTRPRPDESQLAHGYLRECAGKGLAVAVGAHRLGAAVDLLVAAGADAAGDALVDLLKREGLSTALVQRLGAVSGHGCGLIAAEGESTVTVFQGANALLGEAELHEAAPHLRRAAMVYAQLESPLALVRSALEMGGKAGAVTVLNASPWPSAQEGAAGEEDLANWAATLAAARILVVNRAEAARWLSELGVVDRRLDALAPSTLAAIWRAWPAGGWLVVTLGGYGCVAYGRDGARYREHAHAVAHPHPIGAGDGFSAGLCRALAADGAMSEALRLANACGALAAGRAGIISGLPRWAEVQRLLVADAPPGDGGSADAGLE